MYKESWYLDSYLHINATEVISLMGRGWWIRDQGSVFGDCFCMKKHIFLLHDSPQILLTSLSLLEKTIYLQITSLKVDAQPKLQVLVVWKTLTHAPQNKLRPRFSFSQCSCSWGHKENSVVSMSTTFTITRAHSNTSITTFTEQMRCQYKLMYYVVDFICVFRVHPVEYTRVPIMWNFWCWMLVKALKSAAARLKKND